MYMQYYSSEYITYSYVHYLRVHRAPHPRQLGCQLGMAGNDMLYSVGDKVADLPDALVPALKRFLAVEVDKGSGLIDVGVQASLRDHLGRYALGLLLVEAEERAELLEGDIIVDT